MVGKCQKDVTLMHNGQEKGPSMVGFSSLIEGEMLGSSRKANKSLTFWLSSNLKWFENEF